MFPSERFFPDKLPIFSKLYSVTSSFISSLFNVPKFYVKVLVYSWMAIYVRRIVLNLQLFPLANGTLDNRTLDCIVWLNSKYVHFCKIIKLLHFISIYGGLYTGCGILQLEYHPLGYHKVWQSREFWELANSGRFRPSLDIVLSPRRTQSHLARYLARSKHGYDLDTALNCFCTSKHGMRWFVYASVIDGEVI